MLLLLFVISTLSTLSTLSTQVEWTEQRRRSRSRWETRRRRGCKSRIETKNLFLRLWFLLLFVRWLFKYWFVYLAFARWRQTFLDKLEEAGLHREDVRIIIIYQTKLANWLHDKDENRNPHQQDTSASAHYIKLHAPWSLLCRLAEELNLRAPLQVMLVHPFICQPNVSRC